MTQSDLSRELCITVAAISRWHKIGVPPYAQAYMLLRAENIRLKRELDKQKAAVIPK
ncbi:XRE family transcriptional regulator [Kingella negevensis]|uniref:XRE family transcriptional regulator n=1 Tax=Kingella negevensis TaxID=1522312 RepID=UPI00254C9713|nr:XRE family transcriptional regulator [Kingella negevensis]MDK4689680.1 XRE family transcriptional regulator [Kingella negevensis]